MYFWVSGCGKTKAQGHQGAAGGEMTGREAASRGICWDGLARFVAPASGRTYPRRKLRSGCRWQSTAPIY